MRIITALSVNMALNHGCHHLAGFGLPSDSRNGPVLVSPYPVTTVYVNPERRVLVCPERDANPFFHLFESLWMLAGRNDVAFPAHFVGSMRQYSDDEKTLHGAYGYRWRQYFGYDQLQAIIHALQENPNTRRAVLAMWDGGHLGPIGEHVRAPDLAVGATGGKDVPCNTHAYFDTLDGRLNMTVLCRSNDIIFGAYGANVVHFSILLEFVAAATGIPMGVYRQFSNNFHAYTELYSRIFGGAVGGAALARLGKAAEVSDIYTAGVVAMPLLTPDESYHGFLDDCVLFCDAVMKNDVVNAVFGTVFFQHAVVPMYRTWKQWKIGEFAHAKHESLQIRPDDWRAAAQSWLAIREQRRNEETV